jgi:hypothetical protein
MPSYDPDFFNIDPYYDDFDENKRFLKLLFRPGYALQARELTQLQSILQNQIERFGNFILDDGSMVFGGQITEIPTKVVTLTNLSGGGGIVVGELEDKVIGLSLVGGETSYAKIITGIKNPITDEDVIYYQFISGESVTGAFSIQGSNDGITFTASASGDISDGLVMFVDSGIRYTNGYFVSHAAQRLGVYESDGSNVDFETPNSSVGFNINKSIVTSEQDSTLKDPASGFFNFNAAGSDRFKIELEIAQRSLTASIDTAAADPFERTDFIEFARVVAGDVIKKEKYADLGAIEETFARRTYDESGHYVVDPFELTMLTGDTDDTLRAKLDSGKAYVFGYEFETQGSTYLTHNRSRGEDSIRTDNEEIPYGFSVGPFVLAKFSNIDDGATGLNLGNLQTIYFDASNGYTSQVSSVVDGVRFTVGEYATTRDFLPGATLYFAPIASDLENESPPGASASITARIIRVVGTSTEFSVIEIGPPYATGNGWTGGVTSSFESTSPFYVAAGPSFEAGLDYNSYTGSNVSFFATSTALEFTGGALQDSIGTATIRNIQRLGVDTHKIFFDELSINAGKRLSSTQRIYLEGNTGNPAFFGGEYPLQTYNTENTSLVFESPFGEVIKEYKGYDFMMNLVLPNQSFSSGGWSADFSTITGLNGIKQIGPNISSSDIFYDLNSSQIVSVYNEDGKVEGEVKVSGGTDPKVLTIQNATINGSTLNGNATVIVACQFQNSNSISDLRSKSIGATTVSATLTGPDSDGYYYSYFNTGTENLTDVYAINSISASLTGYILDTGQRDTLYDFSKVKVKETNGITSFDANVSYFIHSGYGPFVGGQNVGAGSTASYPNYENIPNFVSNSGKVISLRDAIDFRPVRKGTESSFSLTGPYSFVSFPYDGYEHSADYDYYLPRIDKIILTKDKQFEVLEGIPSENPLPPADSSNAMTLYKVRFNPYTFDENDLTIIQEDNRRFTMKDIGDLERRIQNLEYYSTLSLLEQEAKNTPVYDTIGLERPKKAFLVDQFTGTESSDVGNEDFYCSFDRETKELKPPTNTYEFDITNSSAAIGAGLTSNDGVVTFNFTTDEYLSNDRFNSTRFINSNIITDFNGTIKLNPHCDPWFSTAIAPRVKSNPEGNNDSWLIGKYAFSMNSRFWDYNWFGKDSTVNSIDKKNTTLQKRYKSNILRTDKLGSFTTIGSSISSTPEKVVDTTITPYIRYGSTQITAKGLMPNRQHSIYFDNVLVASGVTSSNTGQITQTITIDADTYLTGRKLVRVMDGTTLSNSTSSADAIFYASGNTKDVASSNFIRPLISRRESSNSENVSNDVLTRDFLRRENKSKRSKENISQLFTISSTKYSNGIFVKSIDVHFDAWPTTTPEKNLPVRLFLKPVVNGYPNPSKIIAESSLSDLDSVSGIGSPSEGKVVRFNFDYPIYLEPNDYAVELESNSSSYAVKTYILPSSISGSEVNERENVLDTNLGSMILPKNLGNTQKINNESLVFTVNKCVFSGTSGSITYTITGFSYPSELRSNVSGVLLDTRFCSVSFNSRTYTPNTTHIIKQEIGAPSSVGISLSLGSNTAISPAVDLRATNFVFGSYQSSSEFTKERQASDAVDEVSSSTGKFRNTTKSRYITKTVKLDEPARNVSVVFDKREPSKTQIKVYLKRLEPNSTISFDDAGYIELAKISSEVNAIGSDEFVRAEYTSLADLSEFNVFAVKIVFVSESNTNRYPSIRNLKVIAV